jgi:phospholipid/cholesterol/gamma-HCH transport system ATP-binding protein
MIEINNLHKTFGNSEVLKGINLNISEGETTAIIGQSGCGKSVLLKHIVGLLKPDAGIIKVDGREVGKLTEKDLYDIRRNFGFLFQGAALFDSMTVEENVGLPLAENDTGLSKGEIHNKIEEMLEIVGLPGIEKLKPSELSGGMKKRVGLARALITNPSYILYDEPTTGLDPVMSESIDDLIKELADRLKVTSILVTHDMFSVNKVAHKVAMIHKGIIYFEGTPKEITESSDTTIYDFIKRTGG